MQPVPAAEAASSLPSQLPQPHQPHELIVPDLRNGTDGPQAGSVRPDVQGGPAPTTTVWRRIVASLRPRTDGARLVDDAPGMTLREVFGHFWPVLRPQRWWIVLGLVLLALGSLIGIA